MDTLLSSNTNIIYGCMGLGGLWDESPITKQDRKKAFKAIEIALENGIDTFDHADIYTLGKAERVFGEFLISHPAIRSQMKIQTKAGIQLGAAALGSNRYNLSKDYLISAIESSLKNLQTEYLDMFLLHRPDPLTSILEITDALLLIKEKGYALNVGVSNMSVRQIESIQATANLRISANQIQFSLGHSLMLEDEVWLNRRETQDNTLAGMLAFAQTNHMTIQAWSPLDRGEYLKKPSEKKDHKTKNTQKLIKELSQKYEVEPIAIPLAWVLQLPANIQPIIGTTNPKRIKAATKAGDLLLTREDWYDLWVTSKGVQLP